MPEPTPNRRRTLALAVGGVLVLGAVLGRRSLSGRAAGGGGGCQGADHNPDSGPVGKALHTTLMGDLLGSGLIAITGQRMTDNGGLSAVQVPDNSNRLGQLVVQMRLMQLQGFGLLSEAFAADPENFINFDTKRKQLLANLDAQEAAFFTTMATYNEQAIREKVEWWGAKDPSVGAEMRNQFADSFFRSEPILRQWNDVPEGSPPLDVTPRISIVEAMLGTSDVSGSIALMCDHSESCTQKFVRSRIGLPAYPSPPTTAKLEIEYRCEGIAGTKKVSIDSPDGKYLNLSCSDVDRFVGNYRVENVANLRDPKWATVTITRKDDSTPSLYWTNGAGKVWQLTVTDDPSTVQETSCYKENGALRRYPSTSPMRVVRNGGLVVAIDQTDTARYAKVP